MPSYLQIENISKSYGPKVLFEKIGFNINEGDKIALIAPNGTGKTSLLRILAGEDSSDSGGRILFLKDIRIAFLQQEYDYDPDLSIEQQVLRPSAPQTAQWHEEELRDYRQRLRELLLCQIRLKAKLPDLLSQFHNHKPPLSFLLTGSLYNPQISDSMTQISSELACQESSSPQGLTKRMCVVEFCS